MYATYEFSCIVAELHIDLRAALEPIVRADSSEILAGRLCESLARSRSVVLVRVWTTDASGTLKLLGSAGTPSGGGNYSRRDSEFREMAISDAQVAAIAATRQPFVVSGLRGDEDWLTNPSWTARQGVRAFVVLPLVERDLVHGVLAVVDRAVPSSEVIAQLHLIADLAAVRLAHFATPVKTRAELRQVEKENIAAALAQSNGKIFGANGAAALLGMRPTTLASRIKALGIR
jgi:transcriptional regulator with GAF, ATPase, and Fis domain